MTTMLVCDDCARTSFAGGCWRHQPNVIEMMTALHHVHDWRLAGQLEDGSALLVCAAHEPPQTRRVNLQGPTDE